MERIRRLSAGSYRLTANTTNEDGAAVTVTNPTLAITDGAGATITHGATPTAAAGVITADIAHDKLTALDLYECAWGSSQGAWTTYVELVGGYLFEIADLRASDESLADAAQHPAERVRAARTAAEERFEAAARVAFVPRGRRLTLIGDGSARLRVPDTAIRRVVSASIDDTDLTADELAELVRREWGAIDRPSGKVCTADAVIEIYYEHGEDFPPAPVSTAAMLIAKEYLVQRAIGSRATVESTSVGSFRISVAGKDGSIGIPEADAAAAAFGRRRPQIA